MLRVSYNRKKGPLWLKAALADGRFVLHEEGEFASHCAGYLDGTRVNWGDYLTQDERGVLRAYRIDQLESVSDTSWATYPAVGDNAGDASPAGL